MSNVTAVSSTSDLANSIIKNFDANNDGALSKDEFASFLGQLLNNAGSQTSTSTSAASAGLSTCTRRRPPPPNG